MSKLLSCLALVTCLLTLSALPASAYDPTSWHMPGYVAGSEGQHTAAYDTLHGHGHVTVHPVAQPQPHALTARQNAYILCVTGREPADFDFDGTCQQITKSNSNSDGVGGVYVVHVYTSATGGYSGQGYNVTRYSDGIIVYVSHGDGTTFTFQTDSHGQHLIH